MEHRWHIGPAVSRCIRLCFPVVLFFFAAIQAGFSPQPAVTGPTITATTPIAPLIKGLPTNPLVKLAIYLPEGETAMQIRKLHLVLDQAAAGEIDSLQVYDNGKEPHFGAGVSVLSTSAGSTVLSIPLKVGIGPGFHYLWIGARLKANVSLDGKLEVHVREVEDANGRRYPVKEEGFGFAKRKAVAIRKAWDDGAHTYRIPGMVQTNKGTLVAVYDVRYINSGDLPGHVDVGMSRSTDGGQTWEPMKIIMDMGPPHENNGVGDPAIVFDPRTGKLIVAALWSKGNRSIAGSGRGLSPDETGQLVISESMDDGKRWSAPQSITPQVKDPKWRLFFQGPGNGMVMRDGRIVFAAQYWDENRMPHSTIIHSADGGRTWASGTGARSNTTEAQVIETTPGKLMLSMRDNRGGFRSIATTVDLGKTWVDHPGSYRTLIDPICMAGFTRERLNWKGARKDIVLFSNPASSHARINMTIRASEDLGETWPHQLLIDERLCYGYSVMCRVDEDTIGFLYEGSRDLYFMRIPVREIGK